MSFKKCCNQGWHTQIYNNGKEKPFPRVRFLSTLMFPRRINVCGLSWLLMTAFLAVSLERIPGSARVEMASAQSKKIPPLSDGSPRDSSNSTLLVLKAAVSTLLGFPRQKAAKQLCSLYPLQMSEHREQFGAVSP